MKKLFTYGTLKRNCKYNYLLDNSKYIKDDYITGTLYDYGQDSGKPHWFPVLYLEGNNKIKGEIWEVTPREFEYIQFVEKDYQQTDVITKSGEKVILFAATDSEACRRFKDTKKPENEIKEWIE